MKLNPHLRHFWKSKKKIKILTGGRASSKTEDTAGFLIWLSSEYKIKVACVRKFQANIEQSVYSVLKKKIENDDYFKDKFTFTKSSIICNRTGSEFLFLGWERNTDQIKGLDNIDIMWIEEGHTLTKEQWEIIKPTVLLRKKSATIIIIFNPNLETDFVYKNFVIKNDEMVEKFHINYTHNPFLTNEALNIIESEKLILDEDDFNHIYLGYPKKDNEDAVIKRKWIEAAIDAHIKLNIEVTGRYNIGYDVADSGNDKNCLVAVKGILATDLIEWKANEDELRSSALKVYNKACELNASVVYDSIGVGAGVGSNIKEFNQLNDTKIINIKFIAGDKVKNPEGIYKDNIRNKDMFSNLKAQAWWNIADRFRNTYNAVINGYDFKQNEIISIDSNLLGLEDLVIELSTPKKDVDMTGKTKVESKQDLAKRGISSPNKADAFVMAYQMPIIKEQIKIENNTIRLFNF